MRLDDGHRCGVPIVLDVDGKAVKADLIYDDRDPYAVQLNIYNGGQVIPWQLSREDLAAGLSGPTGVGDVHIAPDWEDRTRTSITVSTPAGEATLTTYSSTVAEFLNETYEQVPAGTEMAGVDVDSELADIIDGDVAQAAAKQAAQEAESIDSEWAALNADGDVGDSAQVAAEEAADIDEQWAALNGVTAPADDEYYTPEDRYEDRHNDDTEEQDDGADHYYSDDQGADDGTDDGRTDDRLDDGL